MRSQANRRRMIGTNQHTEGFVNPIQTFDDRFDDSVYFFFLFDFMANIALMAALVGGFHMNINEV